jgi:peptide-methionine (S)-S-oxide reductase
MWRLRALAVACQALAAIATVSVGSAAQKSAIFAGGCFWCVEEAFDKVPGVVATTSGYTGGNVQNPTYKQVSAGGTGHYEAVKVDYDDSRVSYEQLLTAFWHNIDPFDARGQFCDKGSQYLSAIFVSTPEEEAAAKASKSKVAAQLGRGVQTRILPAQAFWPAEGYHQNFHVTNSARYKFYKLGCGRAQRLREIWGDPAA